MLSLSMCLTSFLNSSKQKSRCFLQRQFPRTSDTESTSKCALLFRFVAEHFTFLHFSIDGILTLCYTKRVTETCMAQPPCAYVGERILPLLAGTLCLDCWSNRRYFCVCRFFCWLFYFLVLFILMKFCTNVKSDNILWIVKLHKKTFTPNRCYDYAQWE